MPVLTNAMAGRSFSSFRRAGQISGDDFFKGHLLGVGESGTPDYTIDVSGRVTSFLEIL